MDLSGKKILICEEGLISYYGHFHSWIKAIRKMHMDRGAQVSVAANKKVITEIRNEFDAMPVYTLNSWDLTVSGNWPAWRRHLRVFAQNWRVFWQTRRALHQTGPVDLLFFTAARVHHILALRALCAWGLGRKFDKLLCFLLISQAEYSEDYTTCKFSRQTILMKWAIRSFSKLVAKGRVVLAGDSHITCKEYLRLAGVPMTLFPSPSCSFKYTGDSGEDSVPTFSILGTSTFDKGIDTFQQAIIRFLDTHPEVPIRFVVHWGVPCVDRNGNVVQIDERLRRSKKVILIERSLSADEYASYFRASDFIVLPYRKMTYIARLSGVAVEAACSGKTVLVTEGTWPAWAMKEFGAGIEFKEDDAADLCAAILRCCEQRDRLTRRAVERSAEALRYNSVERYLKILWDSESGEAQAATIRAA